MNGTPNTAERQDHVLRLGKFGTYQARIEFSASKITARLEVTTGRRPMRKHERRMIYRWTRGIFAPLHSDKRPLHLVRTDDGMLSAAGHDDGNGKYVTRIFGDCFSAMGFMGGMGSGHE